MPSHIQEQPFPDHFRWLFDNGPSIPIINATENVQVLHTPSQFHQTLVDLAKNAQTRIALSTLYMGNDAPTKELLDACESSLSTKPNLKFNVVCDYSRGNRAADSTRGATIHLKKTYPSRFRLSMYHTPSLRGWRKKVLPNKLNEVIGVQHSKIYLFDDTVVMTGANLSKIYFTNRQDRYVVFKNQPGLCDFLALILGCLQKLSIEITENDTEFFNSLDPVNSNHDEFISFSQKLFEPLIMPKHWGGKHCHEGPGEHSTWVFPTFQGYQIGIQHDSETTLKLINESFQYDSELFMSTGYFNLARDVSDSILNTRSNKINILMASEQANGFYKGRGLFGRVPDMYKYLASNFSNVISRCRLNDKVTLTEWRKPAWSFHGKGIWYWDKSNKDDNGEFMCNIVGSSNFGVRSFYRDTEVQLILVTAPGSRDTEILGNEFKKEQDNLWHPEYSTALTQVAVRSMLSEVPKWMQYFSAFLRQYF